MRLRSLGLNLQPPTSNLQLKKKETFFSENLFNLFTRHPTYFLAAAGFAAAAGAAPAAAAGAAPAAGVAVDSSCFS